jgi:hypothetical protein
MIKMIMWLYFLFLAVAIILTIFGFSADISLFSFVGTIMLFLLGLVLLTNGVDYKVGENTTISVDDLNVTSQQSIDVYESYDDASSNRFGWFLMALGALSFILALFEL